jgi:glycosyltransferase involved in cell wall biosynthesis
LSPVKILLIYDHFLPAWKAGGPIRSLEQLIRNLYDSFDFSVLCSAYEYDEKEILKNIKVDHWITWENNTKIFYKSKQTSNRKYFIDRYEEVAPDIIYINGLFSYHYNIIPLLAAKNYTKKNPNVKIILSPRGMLHPGALSQKTLKKRVYLGFMKRTQLHRLIHWHATDEQEATYIKKQFGDVNISIAGNFPKLSALLPSPPKQPNSLIMGTLALISPMKNHLQILKSLKDTTSNIIWHIYGPVKDQQYWNECLHLINSLPENIKVVYHGAVEPARVHELFEQIHLYIQPSKSENFGHAILEALSAGKPVITTNTTPFTNLNEYKAGYTVAINQLESELINAIDHFSKMGSDEFSTYQKGAVHFANNFVNVKKLKAQYRTMFEIQ